MHNKNFLKIDWPKDERGNFTFPDSANFYGSFSAVVNATRTDSSNAGLSSWFEGLVIEKGISGARKEKNRTLERGRIIDDTIEQIVSDGLKFPPSILEGAFSEEGKVVLMNLATGKYFDSRVLNYIQTNNIKIIAVEIPVWSHEHRIKGRVDYLGLDDDRLIIFDNKGANKPKKAKNLDANLQQISTYFVCLKEMLRNARTGEDEHAAKLLENVPYIPEGAFAEGKVAGRIVRFVDNHDTPDVYEVTPDNSSKFLDVDWRFGQVKRKLKKFYSFPLVLLEETEGFFRAKWKRVNPEKIFDSPAFDDYFEKKTKEHEERRVRVRF